MKKLIYISVLCLLAASCEVAESEGCVVDAQRLCQYSDAKFLQTVVVPTEIMELCLDFDAYMSLTEDEQMNDYRFFGKVADMGNDKYYIRGDFTGQVSLTVDTKGKSLRAAGTEWVLGAVDVDAVNPNGGYLQYAEVILQDGTLLRNEAESTWRLTAGESLDCLMTLVSFEENLYEWRVDASGYENASDGLTSCFDTTDDGIVLRERWAQDREGKSKENIFSGAFQTVVFKDGVNIHRCRMTLRPGFITMYTTNIQ